MKRELNFECDKCGACCRHLMLFGAAYTFLDRGDGICKYLNLNNNLCTIYENRPILCNVKEGYKKFFNDMPYEEYISRTIQGCKKLKDIQDKENDL
jgi:hypothetical protein